MSPSSIGVFFFGSCRKAASFDILKD